MKRTCKKCGVEKDIEDFVRSKQCKFGYSYICRICHNKIYCGTEKSRESDRKRYENRFIYCTKCETCGGFFMARKKTTRYCTRYCAGIAKKEISRPGYVMEIMKKTWIKRGERIGIGTEFKKGVAPAHKKYFTREQKLKASRDRDLWERKNLSDRYVKGVLCSKSNLKPKDIPQSLVDIHREKLKINRFLKEQAS